MRASGSVAANWIEADEALSKKDFLMRVKICRKEAKESRLFLRFVDAGLTKATLVCSRQTRGGGARVDSYLFFDCLEKWVIARIFWNLAIEICLGFGNRDLELPGE